MIPETVCHDKHATHTRADELPVIRLLQLNVGERARGLLHLLLFQTLSDFLQQRKAVR